LTRIGKEGKILICGDPRQSYIAGGGDHLIAIGEELQAAGIAKVVKYTDDMIVRSKHIAGIEKVFTKLFPPKRI
jgi:phosphate starvation-inducible protein PhoH